MRYADSGGLSSRERVEREKIRFQAIEFLKQGMLPTHVAKKLRVTRKSVCLWRQRWQAEGDEALRSRGPGGATCRLDTAQIQRLCQEMDLGPAAYGWVDDQRWTPARVADLAKKLFGVSYTSRGMCYLLRRIGYTPQVPVRQAAQRDDEAIQAWIGQVWPEVKA